MAFTECQAIVLELLRMVQALVDLAGTVHDVDLRAELVRLAVVGVRLLVTIVGP